MMNFFFHVFDMTEFAVFICTDGIRLFLILNRRDIIPVIAENIACRIFGMGRAVTSGAGNPCIIGSGAIEIFLCRCPLTELGSICFRGIEINMTV